MVAFAEIWYGGGLACLLMTEPHSKNGVRTDYPSAFIDLGFKELDITFCLQYVMSLC
jgi:hypothetical protein